jgi:putative hemolysin
MAENSDGPNRHDHEKPKHVAPEIVARTVPLRNRRVGDLMTSRSRIVWLDADAPGDESWRRAADGGHVWIPVCRDGLDDVLGVVDIMDVAKRIVTGGANDLRLLLRPLIALPVEARTLGALATLHSAGAHLALVVSDDGTVAGLVTRTDLLEAIAAEVAATTEPAIFEATQRADGSWLVDGAMPMAEFRSKFQRGPVPPPEPEGFQTVAGLVLALLGRLPTESDRLEWEGLVLEVVDLDGRRIDKLLVTSRSTPDEP